ncbi:MAG: hypothetical protein A3D24_03175 [Candidatus Blackburnbacteria bacterium RIFCSPHIGHO2_02_FULL_39_13]|uniref:PIN domain-containing protein n=1 Tax=Candidatus Blackburnbacteria bacterium RIFCSPLOWO2_01_FULL_40_20 TaxID=1797519 RepID=A0A1G1VFZ8_9BACT|nr:MAG: hypothetical protein A2694_04475 [Candidatus Blackburnbacteria bacterium RIFCSPHIGHO2_01_FULL_40_17]OGY08833.1 MAG: hypothetical protein A3D24_03175 [Candidatus Blackburnbacteria bacterium RIFCSPHIGHO2_02_FULL_39_13]OGY14206.1 MAG: hypothetical protein A3A77_01860 [Candidatus Blackburnbacteria bacterium RIFCSPLOWO2_01_FULL_40_20]HBL51999.1 hypothetical protein [Candidatus Blackburnbacteria bacterium]
MTKIFVDTDVLIDYSKGRSRSFEKLLDKQLKGKLELFINPVVVAEFMTDKNLKDKEKLSKALEFLGLFQTLDLGKNAGVIAGDLLREQKTSFIGDALIAANCLNSKLQLATNNKKHFSKITQLVLYPS